MMQPLIRVMPVRLTATTVIVLIGSVAPTFAQQRPETLTFGAAVGAASTGNSWSGGAGGQTVATHLDLRVSSSRRIRVDGGLMHWTPHNDPQGDIPAGHVWLSHVGVTALRYSDNPRLGRPQGMYVGWGVARYRYSIQRGHVRHPTSWGLHGVAGYEYFRPGDRWGFRAEAAVQGLGGPGHSQVWATTLPMLSASVGLNRRF